MKPDILVEDGWMLATPREDDIDELMQWLPDAASVDLWSGPRFRFPFSRESFREDSRIAEILSYCLRNPAGEMSAFGQVYDRHERGHLARLITHPRMRRQGVGQRLIGLLIRAARDVFGYDEYSLFVYRHNKAAHRCYLSMGFVLQHYPEDAPLKGECYFLTRSGDRR